MAELTGSKTEKNLQEAFAGESQANRTYLAFAKKAEQEGHTQVAKLFRAAAAAETVHAHAHLRCLKGIGSTPDNLREAVSGETHEFMDMYPQMIKEAERRLTQHPDRYIHKVYGKDEAGGTDVIYLTSLPFDELGFKPVTLRPLPEYTWQALRLVPGIFVGVGATLSAITWLQHRKDRVKNQCASTGKSHAETHSASADTKEDQHS